MQAAGRLVDLGHLLIALPLVEWGRRFQGPARAVSDLRRLGRRSKERSPSEREALRRTIARVDARFPGGGNCYRRVLCEIALDAGAARDPVHLGLRAHGGPGSGHAWLSSWPDAVKAGDYEAVLDI